MAVLTVRTSKLASYSGWNPVRKVDQPPVVSLGAYLVTDKFGEEATTVDYLISLTCSISKSIG